MKMMVFIHRVLTLQLSLKKYDYILLLFKLFLLKDNYVTLNIFMTEKADIFNFSLNSFVF